jgi:hypothetical protein
MTEEWKELRWLAFLLESGRPIVPYSEHWLRYIPVERCHCRDKEFVEQVDFAIDFYKARAYTMNIPIEAVQ